MEANVSNTTLVVSVAILTLTTTAFAQIREGSWTPAVESFDRGYSSISYWTLRNDGVEIGGGRISVEHGKPSWPAALDTKEAFDGATVGKLWRLGNNKWTTLDTNLPLRFGERRVEPGIYYLVLQRPKPGEWRLGFIAPAAMTTGLLDAFATQAQPQDVRVLFSVPLKYASGEKKAELDITLALDSSDLAKGSVAIEWGPHHLSGGFTIETVSPTFYRDPAGKE
jgi:hypothetical protein